MNDWFDSAWGWLQTGGPTTGVWLDIEDGQASGINLEYGVGMGAMVGNTASDAAEAVAETLTPPWYATLGGAAVLVGLLVVVVKRL